MQKINQKFIIQGFVKRERERISITDGSVTHKMEVIPMVL